MTRDLLQACLTRNESDNAIDDESYTYDANGDRLRVIAARIKVLRLQNDRRDRPYCCVCN